MANSIFNSNYSMLKKDMYNSSMHLSNSWKTKNLNKEYDILGFNLPYTINKVHRNKKGKH